MNIEHIQSFRAYETHSRLSRQKAKAQPASTREIKDSYQPSGKDEADRSKFLASIRKKIKSGFYNREEVIEDLGDSFAKVFDSL